MSIRRREMVTGAVASVLSGGMGAAYAEEKPMYGLIGSMNSAPGRREELIALLTEVVSGMPGCFSYVVAKDTKDENTIWITEVWDSKESHDASLSLPAVKKTISAARPLIAGFGTQIVTTPIGGYGIPAAKGPAK